MEIHCQRCGALNLLDARFCSQCGQALADAAGRDDSAIRSDSRPTTLPENASGGVPAPASPASPEGTGWRPVGTSSVHVSAGPTASGMRPSPPFVQPTPGTSVGRPGSLPEQAGNSPGVRVGQVAGASARTPHPATGNKVVGEARQVRGDMMTEQNTTIRSVSFRIERYDSAGNRLSPVPVEMRGEQIQGAISEGDWVEVPGYWSDGMLMRPTRLYNLTTHSPVSVKSSALSTVNRGVGKFFSWVINLFFIGLALVIIYLLYLLLSNL